MRKDHVEHLKLACKRLDSSFFYYDLDGLDEFLKDLTLNLHPDIKLWYACKANPLSAILKILRNNSFGIDVASKGELEQVQRVGIKSVDILSTGPSKSRKFLAELLDNEVETIVLEGPNQAKWLNEIAQQKGLKPKVLLRLQIPWDEGESVLGGQEITPFGITPEEWEQVPLKEYKNLDIIGMHCFQWGNILKTDRLEEIWETTIHNMKMLAEKLQVPLDVVDLGGGLGIPYSPGQSSLDFKAVLKILEKLKQKHALSKIWMELGRFIIGPYGYYFTQVIDRKCVRGRELLITDGGINHLARPALTDESFPCMLFDPAKAKSKKTQVFHVHGPLCTSLDKLGVYQLSAETAPADWIYFTQSGAYGFTESMPFFLCHNLPAEIVIYKGDMITPRPIRSALDWLV